MPPAERPIRKVDLFGDSLAFTMGESLVVAHAGGPYDVDMIGGANLGCGVVRSTEYTQTGTVFGTAPTCNADSPADQQWPALWTANIATNHPDVSVLLAGRWEVTDALIDGRWLHIGEPAYDAVLKQSLEEAVRIGTSKGALMILLTAPCFSSGEQDNGQPWPADSAARLADYNAMLHTVAAEHPQTVEVVDFGSQSCPGGTFARNVDGIPVRQSDGVHFVVSPVTGRWLASLVYPEAVRVGRLQQSGMGLNDQRLAASPR